MKEVKVIGILFLVLFGLTACGGGGSSDGSPASTTVSANGAWEGTFTEAGVGTFDISALFYNGRILATSEDAGVVYDGTYTVNGNSVSGNLIAYNIVTGEKFATTITSGSVSEQGSISMSFNTSYDNGSNSTGEISLNFNNIYNRPSSLSLVVGSWSYTDSPYSLTFTVQNDGSFTGQDTDGCILSGSIGLLDTEHNLYSVELTAESCGALNGAYTGISGLGDGATTNDTLPVIVSNDNYVLFYPFIRQ